MNKRICIAIAFSLVALSAGFAADGDGPTANSPVFLLSGTQALQGGLSAASLSRLDLIHTLFAGVELPVSPYTFGAWIQDDFTIDLSGLPANAAFYRLLNNTLSFGIDNTLFFKNVVYFNANASASYGLPYNQDRLPSHTPGDDQPYFSLMPVLRAGGRYYTGLDWSAGISLPAKMVLGMPEYSTFKPTGSASLSFEFFRYYGPRDIKLLLSSADSLSYSMPLTALFEDDEEGGGTTLDTTIINGFTAGAVFAYMPVSFSAGFALNSVYTVSTRQWSSNDIGFYLGVFLPVDPFSVSLKYSGSWGNSTGSGTLSSTITLSWTVNLSTYDTSAPAAPAK